MTKVITFWSGIFLALATYTCVNFTWVFFRAIKFETARHIIESMLIQHGDKVLDTFSIIKVFTLIALTFICHWTMRNTSMEAVAQKKSPIVLGVVWAVMFFLIAIAQGNGEQFIYFQF